MSRRKQDKPQPRKRLGLVNSDADLLLQDLLTCGVCQKEFVLSDIVKFIQHKVHLCNKENYKLQNSYDDGDCDSSDHSSPDGAADTKLQVSNKRPSISAPITKKHGSLLAARLENRDHHRTPPSTLPPPTSTSGASNDLQHLAGSRIARNHVEAALDGGKSLIGDLLLSTAISDRDHHHRSTFRRNASPHLPLHTPSFFQNLHNRCRTPGARTNMVDACTNTTITEPTSYICSTCKSSFSSAWVLVQHAQNMHGLKIYLEPSLLTSSAGNGSNRSTPSTSSVGCLPSHENPLSSASSLAPFLAGTSALDPSSQLLRVPLGERPFGSSLNASALFSRPSSQDIGLLTDHYSRLNNHTPGAGNQASSNNSNGGALNITAAGGGGGGTTSATGPLSLNPFDSHHPFDRGPFEKIRVPPLGLTFEPQMDFYSQRLRQLAGATSPNTAMSAATPSPRKLTPPFGSGGSHHAPTTASSHSSSEPSTPTPSQQTKDHQRDQAQARNPSSSSEKEKPPLIVLRSSSPSSNGSKGGANNNDGPPGSPKLKSCEFCGKSFRFQSNLIVHRRSHTGEKPFKCHICNHACTQASKLKRHMKTHRNKSPGDSTISENTSVGSARSTPDSAAGEGRSNLSRDDATGKDGHNEHSSRKRRKDQDSRELDDGNNSDSQAVDIEDDDDMDEEEEEEEEIEDEDENSTDLIAEDLTTNKSVGDSSNPADLRCNNKEPKTEPTEGSERISRARHHHHETRQSVLGEVMEKIGLSTIQQYNEAYRQALEESFAGNSGAHGGGVKLERPASSELILPNSPRENGPSSALREDGNKGAIGQPALDFGMSLARAFESPLDRNKRLKLDHRGDASRDRDSLFAGVWLPSVASSHRELYYGVSSSDPDLFRLKSTSESALKSVTPGGSGRHSPRAGTSGGPGNVSSLLSAAAAAAAAAASGHLSLTFPSGGGSFGGNGQASSKTKTDRRNDTCEFCGKVFKNCSNLTVHRRSHTGEKPYKCELCSYACAQSSKLTRHMKTHGRVGKDVYRCRFCDMPFSVPSTLEKHMRKCVVNQNSSSGSALVDKDLPDYGKEDTLSICGQPSNDGHESSRRADSDLLPFTRGSAALLAKESSSYKDDVLSICEPQSEESRDDSRRDSDMKEEVL